MSRAPLLHLQSAACGRSSPGTIQAVVDHLALEVTEGSYVAESLVAGSLERLRADLGDLLGIEADGVALTGGATAALLALLAAWPLSAGAEVGVLPGEWAPNVDAFMHHGLRSRALAVDGDGVLDLDDLARTLRADPPGLVHLTHLASHRGLVQPVGEALALCRAAGVPLWVDLAQSLGHLDTTTGADASYAPPGSGSRGHAGSVSSRSPRGGMTACARSAPRSSPTCPRSGCSSPRSRPSLRAWASRTRCAST